MYFPAGSASVGLNHELSADFGTLQLNNTKQDPHPEAVEVRAGSQLEHYPMEHASSGVRIIHKGIFYELFSNSRSMPA
jgi:hypothetical protein